MRNIEKMVKLLEIYWKANPRIRFAILAEVIAKELEPQLSHYELDDCDYEWGLKQLIRDNEFKVEEEQILEEIYGL